MEIQHRGWDWSTVKSESWNEISEEFFPVAMSWCGKYHSILDIGAGKGRHSFFFAQNGFKVNAIDLSESGIEYIRTKAQERKLDIETAVADMTELPFGDESFDCVICFHTIYHTDYVGVKKALSEIHRVLKESGEAYISFNTKDNPNFDSVLSSDGYTIIRTQGHESGMPHCYVNEKDLFGLLKDFRIVSLNKTINYIRKEKQSPGVHFYVHIKKQNK